MVKFSCRSCAFAAGRVQSIDRGEEAVFEISSIKMKKMGKS